MFGAYMYGAYMFGAYMFGAYMFGAYMFGAYMFGAYTNTIESPALPLYRDRTCNILQVIIFHCIWLSLSSVLRWLTYLTCTLYMVHHESVPMLLVLS